MVSPSENKGFLDSVKSGMGDKLKGLLSLPDRPSSAHWRRVARIAADVVVIGLGVMVFFMMTRGNIAAFANPGMGTIMAMPVYMGLVGAGTAWLLQDIIGKKYHRSAAKVSAIILPFLIAGASVCLIGTGFQHGFVAQSMNSYVFAGLLLLPMSFYALARAIKIMDQKDDHVFLLRRGIPLEDFT